MTAPNHHAKSKCQTCQKPFPAQRRSARYCSTNCRSRAYRNRERTRTAPVQSVVQGRNADLIRQVCRLYAPAGTTIADVTYGHGHFWTKTPEADVTGSDLLTVPDRPYDFQVLPYQPDSFDVVVLDPPYIADGQTAMVRDTYQTQTVGSMGHVMELYRNGLSEAHRVARRQVWVKCQDQVHAGIQHSVMVDLVVMARQMGLYLRDTFILVPTSRTATGRWDSQHHARKAHSYLLVLDV